MIPSLGSPSVDALSREHYKDCIYIASITISFVSASVPGCGDSARSVNIQRCAELAIARTTTCTVRTSPLATTTHCILLVRLLFNSARVMST